LETVIKALVVQEPLAEQCRDHSLVGNWKGFRECHIQPDWLLIYRVEGEELQLARTAVTLNYSTRKAPLCHPNETLAPG
jgi:mRNA interferase YafQ